MYLPIKYLLTPAFYTLALFVALPTCTVFAKDYHFAIDNFDSTQENVPVTFGLALENNDLPYNSSLSAIVSIDGKISAIPLQIDRKASFCNTRNNQGKLTQEFSPQSSCKAEDHFLRHAILSTVIPKLERGKRAQITVSPASNTASSNASINYPENLSIEVELRLGESIYTAQFDGPSSTADLPWAGTSANAVTKWLEGNLVKEWIASVPFIKHETPDDTQPHLHAKLAIRHYPAADNTKIDVIVENNWAYETEQQSHEYSLEVRVNGLPRYNDNFVHYAHARWRVSLWEKYYPELHLMHDPMQLLASKAVPSYHIDRVFGLKESIVSKAESDWETLKPVVSTRKSDDLSYQHISYESKQDICFIDNSLSAQRRCDGLDTNTLYKKTATNISGPMGLGYGGLVFYMPTTGARPEIAPLPRWTSSYVVGQTYGFKQLMLSIANGAGSWPVHYRDQITGLPLSIEDFPAASNRDRESDSRNPYTGKIEKLGACGENSPCLNPYTPDKAHQPSFSYVPYIVTGDYYHLEELQFWVSYNSIRTPPIFRDYEHGNQERSSQTRGAAWSLRTLTHAAFITPDNHNLKQHYLNVLKNNIQVFDAVYVQGNANNFGAMIKADYPVVSPWQDDYLTWTFNHMTKLGFESANDFARWKSQFPVLRSGYGIENNPYCWVFAAPYRLLIGPTDEIKALPSYSADKVLTTTVGIFVDEESNGALKYNLEQSFERETFRTINDVYLYTNGHTNGNFNRRNELFSSSLPCGSKEHANEQGLAWGEIHGYSHTVNGAASQMMPALASSVDQNIDGAALAWQWYTGESMPGRPVRTQLPDFSEDPSWNIAPRRDVDYKFIGFLFNSAVAPEPKKSRPKTPVIQRIEIK